MYYYRCCGMTIGFYGYNNSEIQSMSMVMTPKLQGGIKASKTLSPPQVFFLCLKASSSTPLSVCSSRPS